MLIHGCPKQLERPIIIDVTSAKANATSRPQRNGSPQYCAEEPTGDGGRADCRKKIGRMDIWPKDI